MEKIDLRAVLKNEKLYFMRRAARWKARTDIGWLCREVLNYSDVSDASGGPWRALHQPIVDVLQKFPSPTQDQFDKNDVIVNGKWEYKPILPLEALPGGRRTLILDPRGHLKTTINSIGHTIQWILNYPRIAILIFMGQDQKASDVLNEIKGHFQYNQYFRELFPEYVPWKGIDQWGRADRFITEARPKWDVRKEPTVMTGAIEKGAAGYHFEVIKFSDIVDENNISGNGLEIVRKKFYISANLLIGPKYWMDVEGTTYHFGDIYRKILDSEMEAVLEKRTYKIHIRSVFKRNIPGGESFTPDDMKYPFLLDEQGNRIPWWPERFPLKELEQQEKVDPFEFASQKLNWPIATMEGYVAFPVNNEFPKKISRQDYQNIRVAYKEITVDLAETDNQRSNYTAIVVGAVSQSGKLYVEEIYHGRFLADKVINIIFGIALKHRRFLRVIKIEETGYLRGLMASINRVLDTDLRPKGINFVIEPVKRGNRQKKLDRIEKSLQPWYKNDDLRFLDDINKDAWAHLLKELEQFPAGQTDDILDAVADFLANKEYFGREAARFNPTTVIREDPKKYGTGGTDIPEWQRQHIFQRVREEHWNKRLGIEIWPPSPDSDVNLVVNPDAFKL
jgi:hypothetical protein